MAHIPHSICILLSVVMFADGSLISPLKPQDGRNGGHGMNRVTNDREDLAFIALLAHIPKFLVEHVDGLAQVADL